MKPLVVFDLNCIRERKSLHLPNKWRILVPDTLLGEVANTRDPDGHSMRLYRLFTQNEGRVFIGRNWKRIADRDRTRTGRDVQQESDYVDFPATEEVLGGMREYGVDGWLYAMRHLPFRDVSLENEAMRNQLIAYADGFASNAAAGFADWAEAAKSKESAAEWLRVPDRIASIAAHFFPEYDHPEWLRQLSRFPDQLAIGRWFRLVSAVWCLRALGVSKGFGNLWEDIQYAHLASYAGRLLTRDKHLHWICQTVLPNVDLVSPP